MTSERYNRQVILDGFGEASQLLLTKASVLVIGAGGLGCPAVQYLAAAGIGHLGIVDDDTISLSNLHRQVLFSTEDVGKLKVDVARERLLKMNSEIEVISHPIRLQKSNILDIFRSYDFILDGTDNFATRYLINDACALLGKPLIFAAVSAFEGQLAIFNVPDEKGQRTNYRDLFPIPPEPGEIKNCEENGVLGVLPGVIGTMAAAETIKLITGIGRTLINKLLHYNLLHMEQYEMNISPANNYTLPKTEDDFLNMNYTDSCERTLGYTEIDITELFKLREEASTLLVDVRERHEFPLLDDQIYTNIPMSELAAFLETAIQAKNIIFICQQGIRSVTAAELLQEKYGATKNIYSLKGGIAKWGNHFLTI